MDMCEVFCTNYWLNIKVQGIIVDLYVVKYKLKQPSENGHTDCKDLLITYDNKTKPTNGWW
jgi:hypothetical protein